MRHDPLWSRELSENEKRLIWNERMMPENPDVRKITYNLPERDAVFCHKQGMVFMEAADQGMEMNIFAPMYMQSQLAGLIDHECRKMGNGINLFQIDVVMETPEIIVGLLFWFEDFRKKLIAGDIGAHILLQEAAFMLESSNENLSKMMKIPSEQEIALLGPGKTIELATPEQQNRHAEYLEYAYWLGYIYRHESIIHEEDSRMVYYVFSEDVMHNWFFSRNEDVNRLETEAGKTCEMLDKYLVDVLWKDKQRKGMKVVSS